MDGELLAMKGEGCRIHGTMKVSKVHGKIHISSHSYVLCKPLSYFQTFLEHPSCAEHHPSHSTIFLRRSTAIAPLNGISKITAENQTHEINNRVES
mmetsp:Transcript_6798/g.11839  ORF Transcript_6798/g.11839 Transcript_6798/m.11839 type:complete len:96 (+) Transcript_6798:630-917(+)